MYKNVISLIGKLGKFMIYNLWFSVPSTSKLNSHLSYLLSASIA